MIVKRGQRGSVQSVGHSVQIAVEEARAHVEGHGPAGVPQHPLDHLDVGAGGHGEAGCRVPELMGRDVAEAGSPERRVGHPASLVAQHDHPAAGCGEDEVVGLLAGAGLGESVDELAGDGYRSAVVRPRSAEDRHSVDLGHRLLDLQPSPDRVDDADPESGEFAEPEPAVGQHEDGESVQTGCIGQGGDLAVAAALLPLPPVAGQSHPGSGVAPQSPVVDGSVQDLVQHAVGMPDGRSRQACIDQFDDPGGDVGAFDPRYGSGAEGSPLRLPG